MCCKLVFLLEIVFVRRCQQCCYFAKHPLILCAVYPTGVLGKTCADFEAHH